MASKKTARPDPTPTLRAFAKFRAGEDIDTATARAVKEGETMKAPALSGVPNAERPVITKPAAEERSSNMIKRNPNPPKKLSRFARSAKSDSGAKVEAELAATKKGAPKKVTH